MAETKVFIIEVAYRIPAEQLGDITAEHRAFLRKGYERGWLLLSGPLVPRTGGLIVARAPSRKELEDFFHNDPYQQKEVADYRFIEFDPVLHADWMQDWIAGN